MSFAGGFFTVEELACPETGQVRFAPGFIHALVSLRKTYDKPIIVNSCCRSQGYNHRIGGHPRSLHVWDKPAHATGGTAAIDIRVEDPRELVRIALNAGWSLGVARSYLHLDIRTTVLGLPAKMYVY